MPWQVARAALVESLVLCGRLEDAGEAANGLALSLHRTYLVAEIALRSGDVHGAIRYARPTNQHSSLAHLTLGHICNGGA